MALLHWIRALIAGPLFTIQAGWNAPGGAIRLFLAKFETDRPDSRIANASVHLHGGLGSDMDYPIHRHFLWSKSLELQFGGASASLALLAKDMSDRGRLEEA